MKYLKKFETENDRTSYENGESYIEPYVSYVDGGDVHYNKPFVETRLIVRYNVEDASNPTQLYLYMSEMGISGAAMFDKVEIDNAEVSISDLDTAQGQYQFSVGEHTVKYTLIDPTMIGAELDEETYTITRLGATFIFCPITSVEIPDSVTSIEYAFGYCSGLTSVTIPNSVTSIGENAFNSCTSLTSITIPNSVTSIGERAFQACNNLASVTIGNGVTTIGEYIFNECFSLTNVSIPNSVTSIGGYAFQRCGLTSVTIPDSVTSIGTTAFDNCSSLTSVTIPDSVTSIGDSAFYDCTSLTSVTIPSSVTSIDDSVFNGCTSLASVTIPNSVTSIGGSAFHGCASLTSVTIPSSVTSIGYVAFGDCDGLTSITSLATTAPTIDSNTFIRIKINGTLTVPQGSTGYDTWMQNANYYLGVYNWTKVEQ